MFESISIDVSCSPIVLEIPEAVERERDFSLPRSRFDINLALKGYHPILPHISSYVARKTVHWRLPGMCKLDVSGHTRPCKGL